MQRSIPCLFMRGGTSRGPFFLESDLPTDIAQRDAVLLSVMGSPDVRQIDGMGGADPLTSKVGLVRRGRAAGVDLEFLSGAAHLHQNAAGVLEQAGAGIGEHNAAPVAVEEILAQLDFQLTHLAAQGRLHHGEIRGGARKAAEFRDVAKIFELFQIHVPPGQDLCRSAITGMLRIP